MRRPMGLRVTLPFLLIAMMSVAGCGSSAFNATTQPSGSTSVVVLLSDTANDELQQFNVQITTLTLTGLNHPQVPLNVSGGFSPEFTRINGLSEMLLSGTVPDDTYVSATLSVGSGEFVCVELIAGGSLLTATYEDLGVAASHVSVTLPAPIVASGGAMGLSLNLQQSASFTLPSCYQPVSPVIFAVTPHFQLTPVNLAATGAGSVVLPGVNGILTSVSVGSFAMTTPDGCNLTVATNGSTQFQGVSSGSSLAVGMPANMDVGIDSGGGLLATRVSIPDTNTSNLSVLGGPVTQTIGSQPTGSFLGTQEQGFLFASSRPSGSTPFSFGNPSFAVSGQMSNLKTLPFTPVFTPTTMVPGQNVLMTSHATSMSGGPVYVPTSTVTLVPQTLNGTVQSVTSAGGFTVYTILLAPYDLFPNLAVQAGQTKSLTTPNTVVIYADANTAYLNKTAAAVGQTLRFYGLVFDDGGALRMDCAQVYDGVAE